MFAADAGAQRAEKQDQTDETRDAGGAPCNYPRKKYGERGEREHHGGGDEERDGVARIMHETGLSGRHKGRYRVRTTDSNHDEPIAPNRLATAPKATAAPA